MGASRGSSGAEDPEELAALLDQLISRATLFLKDDYDPAGKEELGTKGEGSVCSDDARTLSCKESKAFARPIAMSELSYGPGREENVAPYSSQLFPEISLLESIDKLITERFATETAKLEATLQRSIATCVVATAIPQVSAEANDQPSRHTSLSRPTPVPPPPPPPPGRRAAPAPPTLSRPIPPSDKPTPRHNIAMPEVSSAADAMKHALAARINAKLVRRKSDVSALVQRGTSDVLSTCDEVEAFSRELEALADDLGLQLAGESWETRLAIPGPSRASTEAPFPVELRQQAARAQHRILMASTAVTWSSQILACVQRIDLATNAVMSVAPSEGQRCHTSPAQALSQVQDASKAALRTLRSIYDDPTFKPAIQKMHSCGVHEELGHHRDQVARALQRAIATLPDLARGELVRCRAKAAGACTTKRVLQHSSLQHAHANVFRSLMFPLPLSVHPEPT